MARTERGATQETVRRHNLATLLGHLHRYGPTSRARLTRLLGLNRATIGALVDELVSRGLVQEEAEPERAARGRPSKVVAARADLCRVLAVQVGVDSVEVALMGLGGVTLARRRSAISKPEDRTVARVVHAIVRLGARCLADSPGVVVGVGVAVPGSVSPSGGVVNFAPNLSWRQVPLAGMLAEQLGVGPVVRIGNDANLGAMAEHSRGVGIRSSDLIYLHAEVGVGGGIITGGQLLEGGRGYAGEVGHMQVNPLGLPCHCGARGCWETEVGEDALVRRAGLAPSSRPKVELVLKRARAKDPVSMDAIDATARWISVGLVNMVSTLDPEMVILGGLFEEILELAGPTLVSHLGQTSRYSHPEGVALLRPKFGRSSVLVGAAELGFQRVLNDPTIMPSVLDVAVSAHRGAGGVREARDGVAPRRLAPSRQRNMRATTATGLASTISAVADDSLANV
ncbi:MAG: ROK family transcriptional regulator [Candidatus Dormibacteraeota bacterium]|nr:ROK family transcriptional regulator [Candidatus Dormibacteraeota bacterium]